jgi:hypothetical protein
VVLFACCSLPRGRHACQCKASRRSRQRTHAARTSHAHMPSQKAHNAHARSRTRRHAKCLGAASGTRFRGTVASWVATVWWAHCNVVLERGTAGQWSATARRNTLQRRVPCCNAAARCNASPPLQPHWLRSGFGPAGLGRARMGTSSTSRCSRSHSRACARAGACVRARVPSACVRAPMLRAGRRACARVLAAVLQGVDVPARTHVLQSDRAAAVRSAHPHAQSRSRACAHALVGTRAGRTARSTFDWHWSSNRSASATSEAARLALLMALSNAPHLTRRAQRTPPGETLLAPPARKSAAAL